MSGAFALLFCSLTLVVWRQSRALDELRGLDAARSERAVLSAERSGLQREIQRLESRGRIVAVAGERLGLVVPDAAQIIHLHAPSAPVEAVPAASPRRGVVTAVGH